MLLIGFIWAIAFAVMDMESSDSRIHKILNFINDGEKRYFEKAHLVRTTDDCDVLKEESLKLISQGYNPDRFFSGRYDHILGIVEKKYNLLC